MLRSVIALALTLGFCAAPAARAQDNIPNKPEPVKPGKPVPLNPATKPVVAPPKPETPATKPAKPNPTTLPTTTAAAKEETFPTPNELWEKYKKKQAETDKLLKIAHFDLSQPILEKSPDFTLFGDQHLLTIQTLIDRLHRARDDKNLRGVLVTFSANSSFNLAQAQEIRAAFAELRKAGKRTFAYADGYDTATYVAASGATDVCLLQGGEIMIPGVGIETMFAKGLLDKIGVQADYVQIGEFKGADEQFTRTEPSPEARGELNKIVDSMYELLVDTIATNRDVSKQTVKQIIDDCIVSARVAKERKLIDHLVSQDELRDLIAKELSGDINLLANYAEPEREKIDFSNPFAMLAQMGKKPAGSGNADAIALIHADGVIIDGEAEDGLLGGGGNVGSENIRKAFRAATRDDAVKAIVLRIDSPGGSALASEVMWQAVHAAAQEKPVIVSIGSMAASGGYYLASAGDHIFADPSAIIGSIGVVGGKFVLKDLFEKIGVSTETFARGKNAALFSMNEPWTDRQRRMVATWMKQTYEQFTERVMVNRKGKIKDIDQVARGRIFLAKQARDLGMVDELGGLSEAIKHAAAEVDLAKYDVRTVPASKSIVDMLTGRASEDEARMPYRPTIKISTDSPLNVMPASMRKLFVQQLQMIQLMDKRPVMLVSPYVITVK
jgi:protease-4